MIRFLLLQNRAGKTRLAKYYVPVADNEKRKLEYDVHRLIVTRDPKHTNFAEVGVWGVGMKGVGREVCKLTDLVEAPGGRHSAAVAGHQQLANTLLSCACLFCSSRPTR
jgi:hypothetical protein